jgi:integrase
VKRLPEEEPVNLSRGEILEMINKIPEDIGRLKGRGLKYRALISFLYLTGARVSEIVGRKKTKIKINGIEEDVIPVTPLKKSQIELIKRINNQDQEEISFYIHNLITLKRRKFKARDILLRDKFEHEFLKHFYLYFKTLPNEDSIIFQMSRKQARDIVYKYTGKSPHYFRHYRNYDLLRYYKFDGFMLRAWNNWSSSRSADVYLDKLNPILIERIQSINNIDIG